MRPSGFEECRSKLSFGPSERLRLDGQEMILLPRHFFRYILREVRAVVGEESYHSIFATAGREGAIEFCRSFRQHHDSTPQAAVEGYLAQASLRGWGTLSLLSLGRDRVEILIKDSALFAEGDLPDGHAMWEGVAQGVLIFLRSESALPHSGVPDSSILEDQERAQTSFVRITATWPAEGHSPTNPV